MTIPKIITSAIILQNNKVLLIKRNKEPEKGKWALPGGLGSFKKYPNPTEAIKDEILYDLNVEFNIESFYNYSFYNNEKEGPVVVLHFKGTISKEPIPNPDEIREYKLFSELEFSKLPKETIAFDHENVLLKFFKNLKNPSQNQTT